MDEYVKFIRKFAVYDVLEYISNESYDISKNYDGEVKYEKIYTFNKKTKEAIQRTLIITQWDLLEASFNAIVYGTDYRSKKFKREDFIEYINLTKKNNEQLEKANEFKEEDLIAHIICLLNKQIPYQNKMTLSGFNRLYHIMLVINKDKKYDQTHQVNYIDFESKFLEITGMEMKKFIICYLNISLLSLIRYKEDILDIPEVVFPFLGKVGITKNDIVKAIKLQSCQYEFYKKEYTNSNILMGYPIVRSERFKDKYIITNYSALNINLSTVVYWIIKNYYHEKKSSAFTEYFGHCFEFYLSDFFNSYDIKATKIKETSKKMPDWILETNKYIFLIEQKSGLLPIDVKSNTAEKRFKALQKYITDNFYNTFEQLNNYTPSSNKITIRMCLTFENIYGTEEIQSIVLKKYEDKEDYHLNWIICIDDFEKLFNLYTKDEIEFNKIIENKIELKRNKDNNGRNFGKLLNNLPNDYALNKINYIDIIIENLKIPNK